MSIRRLLFPAILVALLVAPNVAEPDAPAGLQKVVSFQFQDEDVRTVIQSISMFSGVKVTVAKDIQAKVTIHLNKASVRNALAAIAASVDAVVLDDGKGGVSIVRHIGATGSAAPTNMRLVQFEFKDTPLKTIVNSIAQFATVNLVYNCDCLDEKVDLSVKDVSWHEAMKKALSGKYALIQEGDVYRVEKR